MVYLLSEYSHNPRYTTRKALRFIIHLIFPVTQLGSAKLFLTFV